MKSRILLIVPLALLGACAGFSPSDFCEGATASRVENLFYGDSQIQMTPISPIKANSVFRIKLKPQRGGRDPVNYDTVVVEVTAKPATPAAWLADSGSYQSTAADNHELRFCVPDTVNEGDIFWFIIDITPEIGKLDPRAEVVR